MVLSKSVPGDGEEINPVYSTQKDYILHRLHRTMDIDVIFKWLDQRLAIFAKSEIIIWPQRFSSASLLTFCGPQNEKFQRSWVTDIRFV